MTDVNQLIKHFESERYTRSMSLQFVDMLDFIIICFCVNAKDNPLKSWSKEYHEHIRQALLLYLKIQNEELQNKKWVDTLGNVYEEISSSGDRSMFGQFFTPEHVCNLMAQISSVNKNNKCMDCCCGSGRLLLASYFNSEDKPILFGMDLDIVCSKMALVNLFMHGCIGSEIVHGNSIANSFFKGWRIEFNKEHLFMHILEITEEQSFINNSVKNMACKVENPANVGLQGRLEL